MTVIDIGRQVHWLTIVFDRHLEAVAAGNGGACPHVGDVAERTLVAWLPGVVVCEACRHHLEPRTRAEQVSCGACAQDANLTAASVNLIHPRLGPVEVIAGLCPSCHPAETRGGVQAA